MSAISSPIRVDRLVDRSGTVPCWRYALVVLGAVLGPGSGFSTLFSGSLPFFLLPLTEEFGWGRGETSTAVVGTLAFSLLRLVSGKLPHVNNRGSTGVLPVEIEGLTFRASVRDRRFWLLSCVTFLVPFSILGVALHGAALFMDRGLTSAQAAMGAAPGGLGAITARVLVGALLRPEGRR